MNAAQRRAAMGGPVPRTALAAILVAAVVGLRAAVAASESNAPRIRFNPADQKAARAAVLRRADLGTAGWTGGTVKPDLSSTLSCPGYTPKQSDLVVTGAAEAHFRLTGLQLQSIAQVMKTRSMVARDWKRSVVDPSLRVYPSDGDQRAPVEPAPRLVPEGRFPATREVHGCLSRPDRGPGKRTARSPPGRRRGLWPQAAPS